MNIQDNIEYLNLSLHEPDQIIKLLEQIQPDEIYNLAGQSSVSVSFEEPLQTYDSLIQGAINILESIRKLDANIRYYNAGSSECFGNTGDYKATETTQFRPRSPYASAKASVYWLVEIYRRSYGLFACSGILFNHESPLRPNKFVSKKIIQSLCRIVEGQQSKLLLGNVNIMRDWGWAPEYVVAMWQMLQQDKPEDFVIATGRSYTLENFLDRAFAHFNLQWQDYVEFDNALLRPSDIEKSVADPTKARNILGWNAEYAMPEIINMLIEDELEKRSNN